MTSAHNSVSAQRHSAQPTHLANGANIITEKAAVAKAQSAHESRYGGTVGIF